MNLVDAYVTEVIGPPYIRRGWWYVKVKYECWGTFSETELMFSSEDAANAIKPGHHFTT